MAVHLKIDTGMGRLGVWHEQAGQLYEHIRKARHVRLDGAFTHFSSADEDPAFTDEQRRRFLAALRRCPGLEPGRLLIHADNSAGLETAHGEQPFNAVRVGLLQFGILPHPHSMLARVHTEPVFSFRTRVGLVKQLPAGTGISYGRTHTLKRDSLVAVLCAGYGDGIPRACINRAFVLIRGQRCPVLGRVKNWAKEGNISQPTNTQEEDSKAKPNYGKLLGGVDRFTSHNLADSGEPANIQRIKPDEDWTKGRAGEIKNKRSGDSKSEKPVKPRK